MAFSLQGLKTEDQLNYGLHNQKNKKKCLHHETLNKATFKFIGKKYKII